MAKLNSMGLRRHARSYLVELRQRTSFTASLSVLDGAEILYVERARSFRRGQYKVDLNLRLGSRLPVYCTAMGKVLLASLPRSEQDELVSNMTLVRRGPKTIGGKKALRTELGDVSKKGIAVNDEELRPGLVSVACPVRGGGGGVVAAVSLAAHTSMVSLGEMVDRCVPYLLVSANGISECLGFRRDDETAL
ncbi:MAG TPA: IclR family transcriptional regulator C-terminal domain-containing protein [Solirubrobacteraceae bacterium]|jgi:IclR family pca regulon transcriptional regulator|nr:IclR family transcriptional regulator C-terminal domain-containing protein [Solirubrobacteraceae bacterium]